jgi:hypothetical protein
MVAGGDDIARFTCLDMLFCSFWTSGQVGSLQICTLLTLDVLLYFGLDILDLCSCLLDVLLVLTPERLVTLGMFCSLSSGDWKLSSHLSTCSGCGKVHGACLPPMGQNTSAFLFPDSFCVSTPWFRCLPRSFFRILPLLGCVLCGYPHCGISPLPACSVDFWRTCPFVVVSIFSIDESACYLH